MKKFSLTLHIIRSPLGIDWRSPRALAASAALNDIAARTFRPGHGIGHVNIELSGEGPSILTGITARDRTAVFLDALVRGRAGFGVLFHRFAGRLEKKEEIERTLASSRRQNRLRSLSLSLSREAYERCRNHLAKFESGQDRLEYGFPCDPKTYEGGGCSAFAMSFLDAAGVNTVKYSSWRRSVLVPESLTENFPIWGAFLRSQARSWGAQEASRPLDFWCPDLMFANCGER